MRPASHVMKVKVSTSSARLSKTSQRGTSKGRRIIMTTGEVKGMMLNQNAIGESGLGVRHMV